MSAAYIHLKEMGWRVEINDTDQIYGLIDENREIYAAQREDFMDRFPGTTRDHKNKRILAKSKNELIDMI